MSTDTVDRHSDEQNAVDQDSSDHDAATSRLSRLRAAPRAGSRWLAVRVGALTPTGLRAVLVAVIAASVLAVAFLGYSVIKYMETSGTRDAGEESVAAAEKLVPKLLSYKAENVESQFTAKYDLLTGDFRGEFEKLAASTIIPGATERKVTTEAEVVEAGLISNNSDHADVLLFVNQKTTSSDSPDATLDGSRVKVSLTKNGSGWKVSGLRPV